MSVPPQTSLKHVILADTNKSMHIHVALKGRKTIETQALIDSRAGRQFIDKNLLLHHDIRTKPIKHPTSLFNVDGTPNKNPQITHHVDIAISTGGEPTME